MTLAQTNPATAARPWPRDAHGRLLPAQPIRGLRIVRTEANRRFSFRYSITRLNQRRFVVSGNRTTQAIAVAAWPDWLDSLLTDPGFVLTVHVTGCDVSRCTGCDGSGIGRPGPVPALPPAKIPSNTARAGGASPTSPTPTKSARAESFSPEGYTWPELHRLVGATLRAGLSVLMRGHPGVGKSTLAQTLAQELGLPLIDIRLAQRDPSDLCGVWFPDKDTRTLVAYPPAWARQAAEVPCLVFLDEINAAVTKLHQAAAYQIVLEKRVGELAFHPGTLVLAAGNLEEDNAIVTSLSSALSNRFAHFVLRVDAESWLAWGAEHGIEPSILAYIGLDGKSALYEQPDGELAFPSPRSWEMASRVLLAGEERDQRRLVSACVGAAHAERFFAWRKIYGRVDAARVIRKGEVIDFTTVEQGDPSFVYAATFAVAGWLRSGGAVRDAELPNIVKFLRSPGLDPEYVQLFLQQVRGNELLFARLRALPEFAALLGELTGLQESLSP